VVVTLTSDDPRVVDFVAAARVGDVDLVGRLS
jgi:hypothetical protein